jgi:hypothetical protein
MKTRRNDRLSNLNAATRTKLDGWLKTHTYREVVQLAAAPCPEGLGLTTNIRALSVYFRKYLTASPVEKLVQIAQTDPGAAHSAATALIHAQALHAAATPNLDINSFQVLSRYYAHTLRDKHEQRRAELFEKEIALRASRQQSQTPSPSS